MQRFTQSVMIPYATTPAPSSTACRSTRGRTDGSPRDVNAPRRASERDDGDAGDDRAVVEAALEVQREQDGEQDDGDLPGAPVPARETPRGDDERDRKRCDECFRDPVHVCGVERVDERRAGARGTRRRASPSSPTTGDEQTRAIVRDRVPVEIRARPSERAGDPCQHRGDRNRLLGRRGVERRVRRDLADDEDRDAVQRVVPRDDTARAARPAVSRSRPAQRASSASRTAATVQTARKRSSGTLA